MKHMMNVGHNVRLAQSCYMYTLVVLSSHMARLPHSMPCHIQTDAQSPSSAAISLAYSIAASPLQPGTQVSTTGSADEVARQAGNFS
jgi:hypothetical protein